MTSRVATIMLIAGLSNLFFALLHLSLAFSFVWLRTQWYIPPEVYVAVLDRYIVTALWATYVILTIAGAAILLYHRRKQRHTPEA